MPSPKKGQTQSEWMSLCMGDEESKKSFPDQKQRTAVCLSKWRQHLKTMAEEWADINEIESKKTAS